MIGGGAGQLVGTGRRTELGGVVPLMRKHFHLYILNLSPTVGVNVNTLESYKRLDSINFYYSEHHRYLPASLHGEQCAVPGTMTIVHGV